MFNDDHNLNGFNNQNLEGDSSRKDLSSKYKPLEEVEKEVQESWEIKEAYEAIDSSSIELIYIPIIDSGVPFQHLSSSYILYEVDPKEKFLYQHHPSKQSLVDFTCRQVQYQVNQKDFHNQDPYVVMHCYIPIFWLDYCN